MRQSDLNGSGTPLASVCGVGRVGVNKTSAASAPPTPIAVTSMDVVPTFTASTVAGKVLDGSWRLYVRAYLRRLRNEQ